MGRKTREKGSVPERKDYSDLLRELQGKQSITNNPNRRVKRRNQDRY